MYYSYDSGCRFAVLDLRVPGDKKKRKRGKTVFHRLTASNKIACNGTLTFVSERMHDQPKGIKPCIRCHYNRPRPKKGRGSCQREGRSDRVGE